jgi:hypothetical protein
MGIVACNMLLCNDLSEDAWTDRFRFFFSFLDAPIAKT